MKPIQPNLITSKGTSSVRNVALITGSSSGIGLATTLELARRGFIVYAATRDANGAQKAAELLRQLSVDSHFVELNIRNPADVQAVVERIISETGRIDVVINNAGYRLEGFLEDTSVEETREQIETNLMGPINVIRAVIPHMRMNRAGRIINVSCLAGQVGEAGAAVFCASKFGLEGLSESLRHELLSQGIFVSVVVPGPVWTGFYSRNLRIATLAHLPSRPHFEQMRRISFYQDVATRYSSNSIDHVATVVANIATAQTPRFRYYAGSGTLIRRTLKRLLPSRLWPLIAVRARGQKQ